MDMDPEIHQTLWTNSPEFVALQEQVKEIDELADILMAVIAAVAPGTGQSTASDLLSRVYYLRERLK